MIKLNTMIKKLLCTSLALENNLCKAQTNPASTDFSQNTAATRSPPKTMTVLANCQKKGIQLTIYM